MRNTRTHENEDATGILFPVVSVLFVLFLCIFGVYGEEGSRAIAEIGSHLGWLRWLIQLLRSLRLVVFYLYTFVNLERARQSDLGCSPFRGLEFQTLR
jgi:hypothetical protein